MRENNTFNYNSDVHLAADIFILKQHFELYSNHFYQKHKPQFFSVKLKQPPNSPVQLRLVHNY